MRKLTGAVFQSLDGVMQAPGGPEEDPTSDFRFGGWSFHFWDESLEKPFGKVIDAEYDLLLGKRTYDIFAAFWPYNASEPDGIGQLFDRASKFVLTRSDRPLDWRGSHRLAVRSRQARRGGDDQTTRVVLERSEKDGTMMRDAAFDIAVGGGIECNVTLEFIARLLGDVVDGASERRTAVQG